MRRTREDAAESRRRIVAEALRLVGERGAEKVSVADVMSAAGMTHGGFYVHFASKEALLTEVVREAFNRMLNYLDELGPDEKRAALQRYVDSYVSMGHVDDLAGGCPIIGLGPDALKSGGASREALKVGATRTVNALSESFFAESDDSRAKAMQTLATMIGSVVLARALGEPALQERVIKSVRAGDVLNEVFQARA